jgi:uncharacterized protein (DUF2141 family)
MRLPIKISIFIAIFFILKLLSFNNLSASENENTYTLTVQVSEFRSNDGNVRVHLYDIKNKKSFPTKTTKANKRLISPISNNSSTVIFADLPRSTYAFTVHHDENLNEKIDRSIIGFPIEGWGTSNNVKPPMRIPNFEECSFELNVDKTLNVKVIYSLF